MRIITPILLICINIAVTSVAQVLPQPKYDSISIQNSEDRPSIITYFYGQKMVLWKAYQIRDMMYLPGQANGTREDSAYLYFNPGKQVLYRFGPGDQYLVQTYPEDYSISNFEKYKDKKLIEKGQYLMGKHPAYAPGILNIIPIRHGKWSFFNDKGQAYKTIDYTTGKMTGGNDHFIKKQQPFIKAADSILKSHFGKLFPKHVRFNARKSIFKFGDASCDAFGEKISDSILNSSAITQALLYYDLIVNDATRSLYPIVVGLDDKGEINEYTWQYSNPPLSGLPVIPLLPEAMDYNKLLAKAAKRGIRNDQRLYTELTFKQEKTDRSKGRYSMIFYYDHSLIPLNLEHTSYKCLVIDLHTGEEKYTENYRFQTSTVR